MLEVACLAAFNAGIKNLIKPIKNTGVTSISEKSTASCSFEENLIPVIMGNMDMKLKVKVINDKKYILDKFVVIFSYKFLFGTLFSKLYLFTSISKFFWSIISSIIENSKLLSYRARITPCTDKN
jgi:hypothetical protein